MPYITIAYPVKTYKKMKVSEKEFQYFKQVIKDGIFEPSPPQEVIDRASKELGIPEKQLEFYLDEKFKNYA